MSLERLAEILFENATKNGSAFKEGEYVEAMNIVRDVRNLPQMKSFATMTSVRLTPISGQNLPTISHEPTRLAGPTPVRAANMLYGETVATLNFNDLTVRYLRRVCKYLHITEVSSTRKSDIIFLIREFFDRHVVPYNDLQQCLTNLNNLIRNSSYMDQSFDTSIDFIRTVLIRSVLSTVRLNENTFSGIRSPISMLHGETVATLNLNDLTVPHLKKICKHLLITGVSSSRKPELIFLIRELLDRHIVPLQQSITNLNDLLRN